MDAHLFRRFCKALTPLLQGARLEKIQEPLPDFLTFSLFSAGHKSQLCWRHGKTDAFCFLSSERISADIAPSAQVMRLRKYTAGRRIRASVTQYCGRKLWLLLEKPDPQDCGAETVKKELAWLCLDICRGASLHFLSTEAAPEKDSSRWPALNALNEACAAWRLWPVLTPALRRTLAHLDEGERGALLVDLQEGDGDVFVYRKPGKQNICAACAWPLPLTLRGDLAEEQGEDILHLLEKAGKSLVLSRFSEERAKAALHTLDRQARKLERLRQRLQEDEIRLANMLEAQSDALALQENLWRLPQESRGGTVVIPAGEHAPAREIRLDPRRTVRQEMEALFRTAKRGQRGLTHLAQRRASLEGEIAALEQFTFDSSRQRLPPENMPQRQADEQGNLPVAPPGNLPKSVRAFVSDDGFVLLRGRDAKGNLTARKLGAPYDIWLHVENGPGAHVVIRRAYAGQDVPERTLIQAGILAACKSWTADAGKAKVLYAEVRHVRALRNAPAGTVRIDKVFDSREVGIDHTLEGRLAASP